MNNRFLNICRDEIRLDLDLAPSCLSLVPAAERSLSAAEAVCSACSTWACSLSVPESVESVGVSRIPCVSVMLLKE